MKTRIEEIVFQSLLVFCIFFAVLVYGLTVHSNGDNIEHLHESWMIWQGRIPYKDFFQHHNPLLWYIGAPVVGFFEYSLRAVDAANFIAVMSTVITMIYIFRIHKDFLGGILGGVIAISFFALPQESLYNKDFKPDNYMVMGLVVGLYYFLCYIKNKGLFNLSLSFIAFFSAFMFTQKSALILFGVFLIILYLIKDEKVSLKDCIQSGILPVVIYLLYLAYLHKHDILTMYFRANFELNSHIPDVFFTRRYIYDIINVEKSCPLRRQMRLNSKDKLYCMKQYAYTVQYCVLPSGYDSSSFP